MKEDKESEHSGAFSKLSELPNQQMSPAAETLVQTTFSSSLSKGG